MESIHLGKNITSNVVHCPFNTSHTMPQKTLILHLTKCPDKKLNQSICSFNYLHVVKTSDLRIHEAQCPDRLGYDQMIYETIEAKRPVTDFIGPVSIDDQDETWEDRGSNDKIPTRNVIETINQRSCFMKPPSGLSKSERKKYRSEAQKSYSNVDVSYKPNSSISDRIDSTTTNGDKNVNQGDQHVKNKGLFFGKIPNI